MAFQLLDESSTEPVYDVPDDPIVAANSPPPVGHEASLQRYTGTDVYQWFHRTLGHVDWRPYGKLMILRE